MIASKKITPQVELLEEFGLSKYEINALLTILSKGESYARELATETEIPFGRIYDVMNSLQEKGLVEIQRSRPMKFISKDPKTIISNLITKKESELDRLKTDAVTLEQEITRIYKRISEEKLFWRTEVGHESVNLFYDKLGEAKTEMLMYIDFYSMLMYSSSKSIQKSIQIMINAIQLFSKMVKKQVKIQLLLGTSNIQEVEEKVFLPIAPFLRQLEEIKIRLTPVLTTSFAIIDQEKVILKITTPVELEEHFATIFIWQNTFASKFKKKFQEIWKGATDYAITIPEMD